MYHALHAGLRACSPFQSDACDCVPYVRCINRFDIVMRMPSFAAVTVASKADQAWRITAMSVDSISTLAALFLRSSLSWDELCWPPVRIPTDETGSVTSATDH